MKLIKTLAAVTFAAVLMVGVAMAADDKKPDHPPGKQAGCCAKAAKAGKTCEHACCIEAAKAGKNCEKCKGTNEDKK